MQKTYEYTIKKKKFQKHDPWFTGSLNQSVNLHYYARSFCKVHYLLQNVLKALFIFNYCGCIPFQPSRLFCIKTLVSSIFQVSTVFLFYYNTMYSLSTLFLPLSLVLFLYYSLLRLRILLTLPFWTNSPVILIELGWVNQSNCFIFIFCDHCYSLSCRLYKFYKVY